MASDFKQWVVNVKVEKNKYYNLIWPEYIYLTEFKTEFSTLETVCFNARNEWHLLDFTFRKQQLSLNQICLHPFEVVLQKVTHMNQMSLL